MDFTSEIDVYCKNIINTKYQRKGHVYRKSKTIGNISFNRCKSKACSHTHHSLQKRANMNEEIRKHN